MSNIDIPGDELITLDKKNLRLFVWAQAALMVIGGGVAAAMGYYIGLAIAPVGLLLFFFGYMLGNIRLVTTTKGIYHVKHGKLVAKRTWPEINEVELVTKVNRSTSTSSKAHILVFRCNDGESLRYLCGWPQRDRIAVLAAECKKRDIPAIM